MSSTQKSSFSSAKRVLATAASAAMIFALLPAGIALGESPDNVCPPPDGVETFPDVDTGVHADNVECAAGYDIVNGYPDGEYKPGLDVFRAQMATFIVNTIEAARGEAMPAGDNAFDDDDSSPHHANINKLAEAGIVQGQGGDYNPARKVNRAAMATFIANAIDYVDDQDPANNSVLPAAATDHFIDDELSPHEENINRLADAGVVEGVSAGQYDPEVIVFRGQMASFVIESASYLEEQGLWEANDDAPTTPTTNQEFDATPDDAATNEVSTTGAPNQGARQYSVSGLDNAKSYVIALFPAENITAADDSNGVITFKDSATSNGVADWTAVDADIEVVNGASSTDGSDGVVTGISPVGGTITFTIDSTVAESVHPVVFQDADSGSSSTTPELDLDANDQPTEDFGIGGKKSWIPSEATTGDVGATDEKVLSVNKTDNYFTTDNATPNDATDDVTYYYDSNDTFQVSSTNGGACNPASMSTFESSLSTGDELRQESIYASDAEAVSTLCIDNISPTTPSFTLTQVDEDTIRVTVTHATTVDSLEIWRRQDTDTDNGTCPAFSTTTYSKVATVTAESDGSTIYNDDGLSSATVYCYTVRAIDDGDTSGAATPDDEDTAAAGTTARPIITDAIVQTDGGVQGRADSNDVWKLTFNKAMAATTASAGEFLLDDGNGDSIRVKCEGSNATVTSTTDDVTEASCSLVADSSGNANRALLVYIAEEAEDTTTTTVGDNIITYPLTITTVDENVKDTNGNIADVANSTDKVVDKE